MKRIAVFPGSFDPFTVGHESMVRRALPLFDEIIIAMGVNSQKAGYFAPAKRIKWIEQTFANEATVSVASFEGLTVDFCKERNAKFILRGLRTAADLEYERAIAHMNHSIAQDTQTIFMLTLPEHAPISSSLVREVFRYGKDVSSFIPKGIVLK